MRRAIQIGVLVAILALVVRTWLVQGIVDPLVVSGGSMAPALLGAHRAVTCNDCGLMFAVGEESLPVDRRAICPNCGAGTESADLVPRPGQRLIVDRAAYAEHEPRRWDVVVLHTPDDSTALSVKRVVGLPGETIELRAGDVYVDGQPVPRTLDAVLAMAVPVYDADYRSQSGHRDRWQPKRSSTAWRRIGSGYELNASEQAGVRVSDELDWLGYQHEHTHRRDADSRHHVGPILDDLPYNQGESRELVAVGDVILSFGAQAEGPGLLGLEIADGRQGYDVRLDVASGAGEVRDLVRVDKMRDAVKPSHPFAAGADPLRAPAPVVLALVDARLRLMIGGKLLVDLPYDPAGIEVRPTAMPLKLGGSARRIDITDLQVLRDVYYLPRAAGGGPHRLASDEYWLLGDNSAASIDSRNWQAVHGNLFVGKVLIPTARPAGSGF